MTKDILVIGNGFDLAHDLPTKYSDFLEFCSIVENNQNFNNSNSNNDTKLTSLLKNTIVYKDDYIADQFMSKQICPKFISLCVVTKKLTAYNIWYLYFKSLYADKLSGENWIDFEREISYIIQLFDDENNSLEDSINNFIRSIEKKCIREKNLRDKKSNLFIQILHGRNINNDTFFTFRKLLFDDLQKLICALEFYLKCFVDKIQLTDTPSQIKNLNPEVVFSFNYTQTTTKTYNCKKVYYLHGFCKELDLPSDSNLDSLEKFIGKSLKNNNMVIGIDEYFSDDKKDIHTNYVIFKKFVQRIQKTTDKYSDALTYFLDSTERDSLNSPIRIHIYGHSLDVTDKDILYKIFNNKYCSKIIIYCYDKPTQGEYIANIIKIIGQDELIKRIHENTLAFVILN